MDFYTRLVEELKPREKFFIDEIEYEDDVFYREMRRQVSQLTADEDGEQGLFENRKLDMDMVYNAKLGLNDGGYKWPGKEEQFAVPASILSLWRTGNTGTGVFIPQIVQQRKTRSRPRRRRNRKGREHRSTGNE